MNGGWQDLMVERILLLVLPQVTKIYLYLILSCPILKVQKKQKMILVLTWSQICAVKHVVSLSKVAGPILVLLTFYIIGSMIMHIINSSCFTSVYSL